MTTKQQVDEWSERIAKVTKANPVVPKHTDTSHHYLVDGELLDSVTTKTSIFGSQGLTNWAIRQGVNHILHPDNKPNFMVDSPLPEHINKAVSAGDDTRDEAGVIGTVVHAVIENYINEWIKIGARPFGMVSDSAEIRIVNAYTSAEKFLAEKDITPVCSEILVGTTKYGGIAGTMDFFCLLDGIPTIIDWKTSNSIDKDTYAMQVAAYAKAFYEMFGIKAEQAMIVRLDKKEVKYEILKVADLDYAFDGFEKSVAVYNWMNDGEKKLIRDVKVLEM